MANKLYEESNIQAIANAIRTKKEEPSSVKYTVADMAQGVLDIPTGGGKVTITEGSYFYWGNARIDIKDDFIFQVGTDPAGNNSLKSMFMEATKLSNNDIQQILDDINNSFQNIKDCSGMFLNNTSVTLLDLSNIKYSGKVNFTQLFAGCSNLTGISFPQTFITISSSSYMFNNCSSLVDVVFQISFPSSMNSMFRNCSSLKKVHFNSSIFSPVDVTDTSSLFYGCTRLEKVILNHSSSANNILQLSSSSALTGVPSTCKFYVPDALVNRYKAATNWSAIASQIYPLSEFVES